MAGMVETAVPAGDRTRRDAYFLLINPKTLQPLREFCQNVPREEVAEWVSAELAFLP
jgi:hypothetical protein